MTEYIPPKTQSTRDGNELDSEGFKLPGLFSVDCSQGGKTKSDQADQTDIYKMIERAKRGGDLTHIALGIAKYGDFSQAPSFGEAMQQMIEAQLLFDQLPSKLRKRFENEPEQLTAFVMDPENLDELVDLGLAEKTPAPPAPPEPPAPPDPPPITGGE